MSCGSGPFLLEGVGLLQFMQKGESAPLCRLSETTSLELVGGALLFFLPGRWWLWAGAAIMFFVPYLEGCSGPSWAGIKPGLPTCKAYSLASDPLALDCFSAKLSLFIKAVPHFISHLAQGSSQQWVSSQVRVRAGGSLAAEGHHHHHPGGLVIKIPDHHHT